MYDNFLMINGKKLPLTEEQIAALLGGKETACAKVDPFERKIGKSYFFIVNDGEVFKVDDFEYQSDEKRYNVGNYCADKEMMNQRAMHEALNRLLWRYSEQHGGDAEWDREHGHYCISVRNGTLQASGAYFYGKIDGTIYFMDFDTAQAAIEDVVKPFLAEHPEFVW